MLMHFLFGVCYLHVAAACCDGDGVATTHFSFLHRNPAGRGQGHKGVKILLLLGYKSGSEKLNLRSLHTQTHTVILEAGLNERNNASRKGT